MNRRRWSSYHLRRFALAVLLISCVVVYYDICCVVYYDTPVTPVLERRGQEPNAAARTNQGHSGGLSEDRQSSGGPHTPATGSDPRGDEVR